MAMEFGHIGVLPNLSELGLKQQALSPVYVDTHKSTEFSQISVQEQRHFALKLYTREGDLVEAHSGNQFHYLSQQMTSHNEHGLQKVQLGNQSMQSSQWIQVQGNLSEEELLAIESLMAQLSKLSEMFFQSNLPAALQQAMGLDIDSEYIGSLDVELSHRVQKSLQTYQSVEQLEPLDVKSNKQPFIDELAATQQMIKQVQQAYPKLTEFLQAYFEQLSLKERHEFHI